MRDFVSVNGGGNSSVAAARDAMGISWMTKNELNEAITPAYTELIGRQLLALMRFRRVEAKTPPFLSPGKVEHSYASSES